MENKTHNFKVTTLEIKLIKEALNSLNNENIQAFKNLKENALRYSNKDLIDRLNQASDKENFIYSVNKKLCHFVPDEIFNSDDIPF